MSKSTIVFLIGLSMLAGCDSGNDSGGICAPGSTQLCYCSGGGTGVQSCTASGENWGACNGCGGDCIPDCSGVECGDDGCGGSCGNCSLGEDCEYGYCQPVSDPCNSDSDCAANEACIQGVCKSVDVGQFSVGGVVSDWLTSQPISGVTVSVEGFSSLTDSTDSSGNFLIPTLSEGSYTLEFSATNYHKKEVEVLLFGANKTYNTEMVSTSKTVSGTASFPSQGSYQFLDVDSSKGDSDEFTAWVTISGKVQYQNSCYSFNCKDDLDAIGLQFRPSGNNAIGEIFVKPDGVGCDGCPGESNKNVLSGTMVKYISDGSRYIAHISFSSPLTVVYAEDSVSSDCTHYANCDPPNEDLCVGGNGVCAGVEIEVSGDLFTYSGTLPDNY